MRRKRKVEIENKTSFSKRGLGQLFRKALQLYKHGTTRFIVRFQWRHGQGRLGSAYYNSNWMSVCLDRDWGKQEELTDEQKARLVSTIVHEFEHNEGTRHKDMDKVRFTVEDVPWVKDIRVERIGVKKKVSTGDRIQARADKAMRMLAQWERRLKLAQTKIRTWTKKTQYYEKKGITPATPVRRKKRKRRKAADGPSQGPRAISGLFAGI